MLNFKCNPTVSTLPLLQINQAVARTRRAGRDLMTDRAFRSSLNENSEVISYTLRSFLFSAVATPFNGEEFKRDVDKGGARVRRVGDSRALPLP